MSCEKNSGRGATGVLVFENLWRDRFLVALAGRGIGGGGGAKDPAIACAVGNRTAIAQTRRVTDGAGAMQAASRGDRLGILGHFAKPWPRTDLYAAAP